MILRTAKAASLAAVWWHISPWYVKQLPDIVHEHWRSGRQQSAVLEALSLWLQTLFFTSTIISAWNLGERQSNGERITTVQHKKLLKYSGVSLLLVMFLSVLVSPSPPEEGELEVKLRITVVVLFAVMPLLLKPRSKRDVKAVYGLQHGRLHLDANVPMWMNMGYWKPNYIEPSRSKSLAEACRDLLDLVLSEAGFSKRTASDRSRCLIDVGFGCGEQTIHLMSEKPIRPYDKLWWDHENHQVYFDHYIGITQEKSQHQYAQQRVEEMQKDNVNVFCADASKPWFWSEDLFQTSHKAQNSADETWCLALDTAYHFSPSRWIFFHHMSRYYTASIMAFDLCLSPSATLFQKFVLRILTTLMGAPWANFSTPDAYRQKLVDLGYPADGVKIVDISEHVFMPLAEFMDEQNRTLKILGYSLGSLQAAKWLFRWWGETGLVRGVVVVAEHEAQRERIRGMARM